MLTGSEQGYPLACFVLKKLLPVLNISWHFYKVNWCFANLIYEHEVWCVERISDMC